MHVSEKTLGSTGLSGCSTGSTILLLASVFICLSPKPCRAAFDGGIGEPNDPFLVFTAEQIGAIGADPDLWDKNFKLMKDINLADGTNQHFNMIGTD